jgi:putative ATPase
VSSLFADADAERRLTPLAERMRPRTLGEVAGQPEAVEVLRELTQRARLPSLILWGPPGCGKTTIARLLAGDKYYFEPMSAVLAGVKDVRAAVDAAKLRRQRDGQGTLLFLDEIHRFNKAQQDVLLPHVENGTLVLVGATTENPSFEVIGPLLSRCRVIVLRALEADEIEALLWRALTDERGLGLPREAAEPEALTQIAQLAAGDARFALNTLEVCAGLVGTGPAPAVSDSVAEPTLPRQAAATTELSSANVADGAGPVPTVITTGILKRALAGRSLLYDKTGEEHFNAISALHKSLRGSDPDAALYWMARMLEGGEDPKYVVRRMIRFASEDIGLADPWALVHAIAAKDAVEFIGMPECNNALAQLCVYLASAPKSNAMYTAYSAARAAVKQHGALPAPLNIRNAPTQLMKELDYGKDYKYAHNFAGGFVADNYWPDALAAQPPRFIKLTGRGMEKQILERLRKWWGGKYEDDPPGSAEH